jgi:hypothetical protein
LIVLISAILTEKKMRKHSMMLGTTGRRTVKNATTERPYLKMNNRARVSRYQERSDYIILLPNAAWCVSLRHFERALQSDKWHAQTCRTAA